MGPEGNRERNYLFVESDQDFPKKIWYRVADQYWYGLCINTAAGEYKGWPIDKDEWDEIFADWIERGMNVSAEERATLCNLRIDVDEQNACRFFDFVSREDVGHVTVPAVHLAEGLATGWWLIFGGRDREHRIQRYRSGFALPDLRFRFDGSSFRRDWEKVRQHKPASQLSVR